MFCSLILTQNLRVTQREDTVAWKNDKNILEFSLNCTKLAMLAIKAYVGKSKMGIGDIIDFS